MKRFSISINPAAQTVWQGACWPLGPLETNVYLFWDPGTREAFMVDPAAPAPEVLAFIQAERLNLTTVLNTHGHADHIAGNAAVLKATKAELWIHEADRGMLGNPAANLSLGIGWPVSSPPADHLIGPETCWTRDGVELRLIETPGHSRGSVCLWVGDALFSGDTVFAGTVGRTDLPGGSYSEIRRSVRRLRDLLPADLQVFPGHGAATRWAHECHYNPFLNGDADETN